MQRLDDQTPQAASDASEPSFGLSVLLVRSSVSSIDDPVRRAAFEFRLTQDAYVETERFGRLVAPLVDELAARRTAADADDIGTGSRVEYRWSSSSERGRRIAIGADLVPAADCVIVTDGVLRARGSELGVLFAVVSTSAAAAAAAATVNFDDLLTGDSPFVEVPWETEDANTGVRTGLLTVAAK